MKKKLIAALLSAAMVVSVVPVFASDAAADEETATENYLPDVVGFIYRNSREAWYGSKYFLLQR